MLGIIIILMMIIIGSRSSRSSKPNYVCKIFEAKRSLMVICSSHFREEKLKPREIFGDPSPHHANPLTLCKVLY